MDRVANTDDSTQRLSLERRVWTLYHQANELSWQLLHLWEREFACHWCSDQLTPSTNPNDHHPPQ